MTITGIAIDHNATTIFPRQWHQQKTRNELRNLRTSISGELFRAAWRRTRRSAGRPARIRIWRDPDRVRRQHCHRELRGSTALTPQAVLRDRAANLRQLALDSLNSCGGRFADLERIDREWKSIIRSLNDVADPPSTSSLLRMWAA